MTPTTIHATQRTPPAWRPRLYLRGTARPAGGFCCTITRISGSPTPKTSPATCNPRTTMMTSALLAALLLAFPPGPPESEGAWRFVAPAPGDTFEHPPLRALALTREKPEDVIEKMTYRGHRRRYAQLRYGAELRACHGRARRSRTRQGRPVCRRQPQPPHRADRPHRSRPRRPHLVPAARLSHANPEDNEFTLWLALQLANEGFRGMA